MHCIMWPRRSRQKQPQIWNYRTSFECSLLFNVLQSDKQWIYHYVERRYQLKSLPLPACMLYAVRCTLYAVCCGCWECNKPLTGCGPALDAVVIEETRSRSSCRSSSRPRSVLSERNSELKSSSRNWMSAFTLTLGSNTHNQPTNQLYQ